MPQDGDEEVVQCVGCLSLGARSIILLFDSTLI